MSDNDKPARTLPSLGEQIVTLQAKVETMAYYQTTMQLKIEKLKRLLTESEARNDALKEREDVVAFNLGHEWNNATPEAQAALEVWRVKCSRFPGSAMVWRDEANFLAGYGQFGKDLTAARLEGRVQALQEAADAYPGSSSHPAVQWLRARAIQEQEDDTEKMTPKWRDRDGQ